jgi:transcriptional regulator with XRE-family HTH domain
MVRSLPLTWRGVNRIYLSKLEKGGSYPGLEIIAKLATVLEVEPARYRRQLSADLFTATRATSAFLPEEDRAKR